MLELAICDDDIILCNWLEQKLLHYGKANDCQISVEIYYSAEQLLNRLEEESYDMLFLDICLGHENGIDIGTEIRKKNYGKELRITYISTYQEYAMKLFRRELGITIGQFIMRCKFEEAKSLLTYTDMSLSEISHYLCFSSQSYFQNVFRKKYNITPDCYRKGNKECVS